MAKPSARRRALTRAACLAVLRARWLDDAAERGAAVAAFVAPDRPAGFRLTEADRAHLEASLPLEIEIAEVRGFASGA